MRVQEDAKNRLQTIADEMDLTLSDVARMAMSRGLPILEKEHRLGR